MRCRVNSSTCSLKDRGEAGKSAPGEQADAVERADTAQLAHDVVQLVDQLAVGRGVLREQPLRRDDLAVQFLWLSAPNLVKFQRAVQQTALLGEQQQSK